MNTKKLKENILYWHDKSEIPSRTDELILIIPNKIHNLYRNIYSIDNLYYIGRINLMNSSDSSKYVNTDDPYSLILISGDNKDCIDEHFCSWNKIVNKWIYIKDVKSLIE